VFWKKVLPSGEARKKFFIIGVIGDYYEELLELCLPFFFLEAMKKITKTLT
jgi:hypothetical protein